MILIFQSPSDFLVGFKFDIKEIFNFLLIKFLFF